MIPTSIISQLFLHPSISESGGQGQGTRDSAKDKDSASDKDNANDKDYARDNKRDKERGRETDSERYR